MKRRTNIRYLSLWILDVESLSCYCLGLRPTDISSLNVIQSSGKPNQRTVHGP